MAGAVLNQRRGGTKTRGLMLNRTGGHGFPQLLGEALIAKACNQSVPFVVLTLKHHWSASCATSALRFGT